jgi:hypothetical protein
MSLVGVLAYFFKEVMLFVSYVKNNAFPQPLSENEEKQYLKDMANGDEHARGLLKTYVIFKSYILKLFNKRARSRCSIKRKNAYLC